MRTIFLQSVSLRRISGLHSCGLVAAGLRQFALQRVCPPLRRRARPCAERIAALGSVHSLFAQSRWTGADLASLVRQELSPYSRKGEMRTHIDGPAVMLKPDAAQAIAVTLHELATNAAKYGSLSVGEGQVRVEWLHSADGQLVLRWTKAGGPPVDPPTRRGFGTNVIEGMIRGGAKGEVRLDRRAEGLACEITVPT